MDTRLGLLIICAGLFGLVVINQTTSEPDPFAGQKQAARNQIRSMARDPDSVKFHSLSAGSGENLVVIEADFSARNGFGGVNRENWRLGFDRHSGGLVMVRDEKTGRMLLDGMPRLSAVAAPPPAAELLPLPPSPLEAPKNEADFDARVKAALEMVKGGN